MGLTWLRQSTGISWENAGLSGLINGVTMSWRVYWKTTINKLLWGFSVGTDKEIQARRPELVIIGEREKGGQIIDVAIQEDCGVRAKEDEKVEKYQDLAREV